MLAVRKEICSNLTLTDTPKQKGLPNNRIECTHDVLACNKIVVSTGAQGTCPVLYLELLFQRKEKEEKKFFLAYCFYRMCRQVQSK